MKRTERKGDVLDWREGKKHELWLCSDTGSGILDEIVMRTLALTEERVEGRVHIRKARNGRIIIEQEEP